MKLIKIYLRYYPPGIALNYRKRNVEETKMIDLFDLTPSCDLPTLTKKIALTEPLITQEVFPQVTEILEKLQKKLKEPVKTKFYLFKTLQTHILPLTNVAFDKSGKNIDSTTRQGVNISQALTLKWEFCGIGT